MTLLRNDPTTQLAFSVYENKGVFAVLLGSGLSRSAEIPTGWEITLDLVRRVALTKGVEDQSDWTKWYRDETGQEPNYSTLLEEIATSPAERRAILHRYIEPDEDDREEGRKIPTEAHHAIASLVRSGHIRVIITTNFDRLMENALREQGIEPTVVSSADALAGAEPLTHSRCYLLKLHGDYKDSRILNTDQELSSYPDSYNKLLDRIFDEHGLIICGWSGEWDHALRAAFLRAPNRRYPVYWAARGKLGGGATELAEHRDAKTVAVNGADEFFRSLQQRVETLEQSQRQNPLSVELLVSSAKRYLAKSEYRIQLDELFTQEFERLLIQLRDDQLSPQGRYDPEQFRFRVALYEALTEPLARMVGVLGRWGDGSELPLALDIIGGLHRRAVNIRSGSRVWIGLSAYPAVLVFTAYAVALTRSQRWSSLHALLDAPLSREYGKTENLVSTLFLQAWGEPREDVWKQLEGFENRRCPLSDHLFDVLSVWKSSFIGVSSEFNLTFDRFETLATLAYFERYSEEDMEKAIVSKPDAVFAGMPIGRAVYHDDSAMTLINDLQLDETIVALLNAGFARNSRRYLELFVENFKRYVGSSRWW
ncbi:MULTISPECIES: SIR2 family protein [Thalassospira]|uniref:Uncharacterized protein n=2 Tax=Thalassospira TaxID=168934 RepID=A0A367WGX9_9PROT|nr:MULTISPECIES: SIR2 family protein [Thalassospira]MDG4718853.1 SIR2 family protein [Thalassospira sp. FZY0004]RCK39821.1 hypothetical protein TH19_01905 [Thalassospira profundimaris]